MGVTGKSPESHMSVITESPRNHRGVSRESAGT